MSDEEILGYTQVYCGMLTKAIAESAKLGFTRPVIISPETQIKDGVLRATSELLGELSGFLGRVVLGYWGNSCQTLSTNIFAHLNNQGIAANIVLGNVWVGATDEFETTLESLQEEVQATNICKVNRSSTYGFLLVATLLLMLHFSALVKVYVYFDSSNSLIESKGIS